MKTNRAADVNIMIMRTFVRLRLMLTNNQELARKIQQHDRQIGELFEYVRNMLAPPVVKKRNPIGFGAC